MKVGIIQGPFKLSSARENWCTFENNVDSLVQQKVNMICICEEFLGKLSFVMEKCLKLAKTYNIFITPGVLIENSKDSLKPYIISIVIDPEGRILVKHRKVFMPPQDSEYFNAGNSFDDCIFDFLGIRSAILICGDIISPIALRYLKQRYNIELVILLLRLPEDENFFIPLVKIRAAENNVAILMVNVYEKSFHVKIASRLILPIENDIEICEKDGIGTISIDVVSLSESLQLTKENFLRSKQNSIIKDMIYNAFENEKRLFSIVKK